tara:strand:+ start:240 stop:572 length:333 start_codon:yes stop_codon:yes gene_type:complete
LKIRPNIVKNTNPQYFFDITKKLLKWDEKKKIPVIKQDDEFIKKQIMELKHQEVFKCYVDTFKKLDNPFHKEIILHEMVRKGFTTYPTIETVKENIWNKGPPSINYGCDI